MHADTIAKSESERPCGALGTFDQGECLSKLILFGRSRLQRVVSNFWNIITRKETTRQDNLLLFPVSVPEAGSRGAIRCREQPRRATKYYRRAA